MSTTIRGITVEIAGNTTALTAALQDVNQRSRSVQSELSQVQRLLRMDPGNTTLIAQQQQLLAEAVDNSREKLNRLRAAEQQVRDQFARGEISQGQMRAFEREVARAEQELRRFEEQTGQTQQSSRDLGQELQQVGDMLNGIGQTMSMAVTAPIVGAFVALTQGTSEFRGDLARLATNAEVAGQEMDVLNEAMATLNAVTGETDSSVEGLSNLLATGFRDEQLTELLDSLYGATIKFSDTLKFEGIADGLQETLATGAAIGPFAELLERSGVNLDNFNAGLQAAIANGTQENFILQELAKTGLAETYEAYRKNNEEMIKAGEANFRMQQAFAKMGATLEPILTPIINKITELVSRFNEMDPAGQKVVLAIAGIAAAIGPVLVVVGSAAIAFATLGPVFAGVGTALAALTGPIGLVAIALAGIGLIVYGVIKNWDEIKAKAAEIWDSIKSYFEQLWQVLTDTARGNWEQFKADITGVWDTIRNFAFTTWNKMFTDATTKWAEIGNFINTVINTIKTTFTGLVDSALNWGSNLISNFISGITSGFDRLRETIANVAVMVGDYLGFMSPTKKGPGREADKWAPNFVDMYAEGISKAMPQLQSVIGNMASTLQLTAMPTSGNTYNSGGNVINITVQDGEDLIRTLHRLGVRLP